MCRIKALNWVWGCLKTFIISVLLQTQWLGFCVRAYRVSQHYHLFCQNDKSVLCQSSSAALCLASCGPGWRVSDALQGRWCAACAAPSRTTPATFASPRDAPSSPPTASCAPTTSLPWRGKATTPTSMSAGALCAPKVNGREGTPAEVRRQSVSFLSPSVVFLTCS